MNRQDYRKAFDAISFSEDFAPRTQALLLSYTPLVSGCHMGVVNAWTLGANCQSFVEDGAAYYLFDTRNLEIFADHTVYFAIYAGGVPSPEEFTMEADGSLRFAEDFQGAHALFTLPLDASKADSAAAEAFAAGTGLEFPPMEREEPQG